MSGPNRLAVGCAQTRFYDQLGRAINHNPDMLARTQVCAVPAL